jgi:aminoglycoside phosphotransferase family enzyme/predicted kinase
MDPALLIEALANPAAYLHAVDRVEVRHTHISIVFLAGPYAYKVKKPVTLPFVDFSRLDTRRYFCDEEVRLNRRLAPEVYLGAVPIASGSAGLEVEGPGEVVEWAVKMQRLPEGATLQQRLRRGEVNVPLVAELARKVASFHGQAEGGPRVAAFGRFEVVAGNARDNFDQSASQVGHTVSAAVLGRLRRRTEEALTRLRTLIDGRAARGVPRDTHGDLHLDHVYLFPNRPPPGDLVIIDCVEFNEGFRFADPVADMAFLAMDFTFHGRRDLAGAFADAYFAAAGDEEGRALLPFYTAYRAAVRGKVEGLKSVEAEVPDKERAASVRRARAHWLIALAELEEPRSRPCLVLVGGLPGTGKSTLARALAAEGGFTVVRSDVVRKELAASAGGSTPALTSPGETYTPEWTENTYAACLKRATQALFEGQRVIVDATFRADRHRANFLRAAVDWGVPAVFLGCDADPAVVRERLARRRGDVSDADWSVYELARSRWEKPGVEVRPVLYRIATDQDGGNPRDEAATILRQQGLW